MRVITICSLLALGLVATSAASVREIEGKALLHRSRRSVLNAIHSLWLSRRKRDVPIANLVALRKRLTRVRRSLASGPPRVIKLELKFKRDWLKEMSKPETAQYQLMDGNVMDALFTELIGDPEYIEAKLLTLKKSSDKHPHVLGDLELHFDQNEEDPVKHLREIVREKGRISSEEVFHDYFVVLDDGSEKPKEAPVKPVTQDQPAQQAGYTQPQTAAKKPAGPYKNRYQEFSFDIHLKRPWDPKYSDYNSDTEQKLEGHIRNLVKLIFDKIPGFVNDRVAGINDGPDSHPFVRIVLVFKPGVDAKAVEAKMLQLVKSGLLGDIHIFDNYLNGWLPGKEPPENTTAVAPAPALAHPTRNQVPNTPKDSAPTGGPTAAAQPAQSMAQPKQDAAPVQSTVQPTQPKQDAIPAQSTAQPTQPTVQSTVQPTQPTAQAIAQAQPTVPIQPYIKYTTPTQVQADQTKYLNGSIKLDKTWYPFIGDVNGATHKILSHDIEEAIKDSYGGNVPVTIKVDSLGPTPDNKIQATYTIGFPSSMEPTLKPLNDALGQGNLGGLPLAAPTPENAPAALPPTASTNNSQYSAQNTGQTNQVAPIVVTASAVPILPSAPPTVAYHSNVVPLPSGIPHSCEEVRSSGIGTKDGEYVLLARPDCHLNIICQNMNDPHPKEYLGGPSQRNWHYWNYAALIKLSAHDKQAIDKRACLENTAVGREFISKVMAAGARQGNPLVAWKTNVKRMINSYIGKKKRRSLEDITLSTRAIKIYKKYSS